MENLIDLYRWFYPMRTMYLPNDDVSPIFTSCKNDIRNKRTSLISNNPLASSILSLVFFDIDSGKDLTFMLEIQKNKGIGLERCCLRLFKTSRESPAISPFGPLGRLALSYLDQIIWWLNLGSTIFTMVVSQDSVSILNS